MTRTPVPQHLLWRQALPAAAVATIQKQVEQITRRRENQ
jgi:hypothetical protein